jgi:tRNA-splicing endonuclease subunit Sen54
MPSLSELDALFDILPELPPPLPRQRHQVIDESPPERYMFIPILISATQACCQRLFPCVFSPRALEVRKPNPFVALKSGKKNVVIAAVDAGSISFFRFNQGAFSEWPMT